jgi:starvation-inducible DNA-binding protein
MKVWRAFIVRYRGDQPTLDALAQRMDVHEKNAWMLRSLLKK